MKTISVFKTGLLMFGLIVLFTLVGRALDAVFGTSILMYAFLAVSMGMNYIAYWHSDKIVLKMYKARPVSHASEAWLHRLVERLSYSASIPIPKVYMIPADIPNAFATGRNPENAAIAVTQGIVNALTVEELEGVLAHEIAHIKNRDTLISTLVAGVAGMISLIGQNALFFMFLGAGDDDGGGLGSILLLLLAPFLAIMIQMGISRQREYLADETGARICGRPLQLASALEKIESFARRRPVRPVPATSHMFIINPFRGDQASDWFSTHPSTQTRIERLRALADKMRIYA